MTGDEQRRLKLFISYAHEDDALREKLDAHLAQLRRDDLIEEWHEDIAYSLTNFWFKQSPMENEGIPFKSEDVLNRLGG
jgi:hypothetical protein